MKYFHEIVATELQAQGVLQRCTHVRSRPALGALALLCLSFAPSARAMSLEDALAAAYLSNPQLEAERAGLRATDEEVAKALAGWRPRLNANGAYGWQDQSQTLLGPQAVQSIPQSQQLSLSQPIFDGRTIPATAHAKDLVDAGRAQLANTENTVLFNACTAYFQVLRDTQIVEAYRADVTKLRAIADNIHARLKLGELTRTDSSQADARLLGSQLAQATAEQQLNSDRATFEHIVGRPAELLSEHADPSLPPEQQAGEIALRDNPKLLQAKAQARAADEAVDTAVGSLLPSMSVQAQYGRSIDQIAPGVRENGFSVIGQLNIPLYQGGAEEAGIRQAKEQRTQALLTSYESERQVREDFATAWSSYAVSRKAAELAISQTRANDVAYEGSTYEARVGSRSVIDILNADQELLQARVAAITQENNARIAGFGVLRVMGRMSAESLKLPVKVYDPRTHYDADATSWFGFGD